MTKQISFWDRLRIIIYTYRMKDYNNTMYRYWSHGLDLLVKAKNLDKKIKNIYKKYDYTDVTCGKCKMWFALELAEIIIKEKGRDAGKSYWKCPNCNKENEIIKMDGVDQ